MNHMNDAIGSQGGGSDRSLNVSYTLVFIALEKVDTDPQAYVDSCELDGLWFTHAPVAYVHTDT